MYRFFEKDRLLSIPRRIGLRGSLRGRGVGIAFLDSGFYPHPDLMRPNRVVAYRDFTGGNGDLFGPPDVLTWHGLQTTVVGAGNGRLSRGRYRSCAPEAHMAFLKVKDHNRIRLENFLDALIWLVREGPSHRIKIAVIAVALDQNVDRSGIVDAWIEAVVKAGIFVVAAAGNSYEMPMLPPASAPEAFTVGGYVDNNSARPSRFTPYPGPRSAGKPDLLGPAAFIPTPLHPAHPLFNESPLAWRLYQLDDAALAREFRSSYRALRFPANSRRLRPDAIRALLRARIESQKFVTAFYQHGDGTSFAAPIVASVAACMLEENPRLSPRHLRGILKETSTSVFGPAPILNAAKAVAAAAREKSTVRLAG